MRMRSVVMLVVLAAVAAVAGRAWTRRAATRCEATVTPSGPIPTAAEMVRLIGDAQRGLAGSRGRAAELSASVTALESAIRDGPPARQCEALTDARKKLRALPDSPETASQRNALALAFDLTAAFIARNTATNHPAP